MPERVQLQRKAGWRLPANTKSVARPGIYGNPWRVTPYGPEWAVEGPGLLCRYADRELAHKVAAACFRGWLLRMAPNTLGPEMAHRRERILNHLPELRGWNLACWCGNDQDGKPLPCHADLLIELANPEDTAA